MLVVLPVPLTPTMRIALGLAGSGRMGSDARGKIATMAARVTSATSSAVTPSPRACNVLMISNVSGTPRSARMSVSSSSSQSTGRPVNFWTRFLKKTDGHEGKLSPLKPNPSQTTRAKCHAAPGVHDSGAWPLAAVRRGRVRSSLTRSRMPLTKRLLSSVPKRFAISMASLIDTTGGMSCRWSIS